MVKWLKVEYDRYLNFNKIQRVGVINVSDPLVSSICKLQFVMMDTESGMSTPVFRSATTFDNSSDAHDAFQALLNEPASPALVEI